MVLSHRVALNGVQLDSIDSRILVQGIEEQAGKDQISAVGVFGGVGQRVTNEHRDFLDVIVRFSIHQKKSDMQARSDVFEKVNAWAAAKGWLTINYKSNRRLWVRCANCPAAGDQWKWTGIYSITFRAYEVPYWQQVTATAVTATGSSISTSITVLGHVETVLDVSFTNTSGQTCSTFSITAGGSTIALINMVFAAGETLYIDHTETGKLRIRIKNTSNVYRSVLAKRTTASSNDLWVNPGTVNVTVTAAKAGTLTLSCAGRFK